MISYLWKSYECNGVNESRERIKESLLVFKRIGLLKDLYPMILRSAKETRDDLILIMLSEMQKNRKICHLPIFAGCDSDRASQLIFQQFSGIIYSLEGLARNTEHDDQPNTTLKMYELVDFSNNKNEISPIIAQGLRDQVMKNKRKHHSK